MTEKLENARKRALKSMREDGVLGATMNKVVGAITAENAPEWAPAWLLCAAAELAPADATPEQLQDPDNDVVQAVIRELAAGPWYLTPEERDGVLGWPTQALKDAAKAYLDELSTGSVSR